jgi:hypothetical protein
MRREKKKRRMSRLLDTQTPMKDGEWLVIGALILAVIALVFLAMAVDRLP